ncbi:MAG: hypothetical protein A2583_10475 [Bdellovibrionales bacterium RIFOXYD1_FULL_53_11]|nr:MAG: hypothetical protein A2583_10475 [Bdellovibrionales bacterium RIFOXYD1_FULL_53_11]
MKKTALILLAVGLFSSAIAQGFELYPGRYQGHHDIMNIIGMPMRNLADQSCVKNNIFFLNNDNNVFITAGFRMTEISVEQRICTDSTTGEVQPCYIIKTLYRDPATNAYTFGKEFVCKVKKNGSAVE